MSIHRFDSLMFLFVARDKKYKAQIAEYQYLDIVLFYK